LIDIRLGDCIEVMRGIPDGAARCCVTSPPYFGLRDYGVDGQIGLEATPDAFIAKMVEVFREVRRVLSDDGTLWLNLGDSYNSGSGGYDDKYDGGFVGRDDIKAKVLKGKARADAHLGPKQLIGIPWRVALALQADGWYLRSDIIWAKPNPMPESVRDRPTKAHEYVFLLAKNPRYFYDAEAVREEATFVARRNPASVAAEPKRISAPNGVNTAPGGGSYSHRNARTVWTITPRPFKGCHFATFPPELAERCIKAGSAEGDTVLDPFAGAGTVGLVCQRLGRSHIGAELNPAYRDMALARIKAESSPLLESVA
jgi:DNA modification methylase